MSIGDFAGRARLIISTRRRAAGEVCLSNVLYLYHARPPSGILARRSTAAGATATGPAPSSSDEVEKAVDAHDPDQHEVDCDDIVLQSRHEQNHRPTNEGKERQHVMNDGGHPHGVGLLLG